MFTGLVETIGTVTSLLPLDPSATGGSGTSLTISTSSLPTFLSDAQLGDSICVNGTCLTITELPPSSNTTTSPPSWFKVGIAPETLRRTNLGRLTEKSRVNLERSVTASTRMGGHFVQGHVDTVATIASITPDGNALVFRFAPRSVDDGGSGGVMRYIVEKGYVTVDGASLTVTRVDDGEGWFEVMLISYTQEKVVTASKKVGDEINVEIDVVGKYVEKSVGAYFQGLFGAEDAGNGAGPDDKVAGDWQVVDGGKEKGAGGEERGTRGGPAILEKMVKRWASEEISMRFKRAVERADAAVPGGRDMELPRHP